MHRWMKWSIGAVVPIAIAVGVWWRFAPRGLAVETALVARTTFEEVLVEEGRTRARWHLDLAAPVTGAWAPGPLTVGDTVPEGMPVGVLAAAAADPATARQIVAQVGAAEATVEAARAIERAALVAATESGRSAARVERLGPVGGISPQALDEVRATADARQREYEAARARVTAAVFARDAARALLPGAGAPVIVRAPTAGVVLRVDEEHPRVVPAGTPLLMLGAFGWPDVVVDILSRDAPRIPAGASMRVVSGTDTLLARVRRVEPTARTVRSALGVDEQRVQVVAEVLRAPQTLGHDFAVEARIVLARFPQAMVVPTGALVRDGSRWAVFVVDDAQRARHTPVRLVARGEETAAVEGVDVGQRVVVYPPEVLREGTRVR